MAHLPELEPDRLYTAKEVAAFLSVHVVTIYGWMQKGTFPRPFKIGPRAVRWSGRQLSDHLNKTSEAAFSLPW